MGQLVKIELSRKEVDQGEIPHNFVLVEAELTAEGKKTKGGIIVGHDEDVNFHSEEENVNASHEADVAQVVSRVYKVPQKLYFNKENHNGSMSWDCDMDLQVGDLVWYSFLESRNAVTIVCDGEGFKLIPYADIYCAKRERWLDKWTKKKTTDIICLNGYVLLEQVFHKNKSSLAISEMGDVDKTRGIVRYVGEPNREYLHPAYVDFPNLEVGDEVLLAPGSPLFLLERKKYLAEFDNDKLYWVCQSRRISMVLSKGN